MFHFFLQFWVQKGGFYPSVHFLAGDYVQGGFCPGGYVGGIISGGGGDPCVWLDTHQDNF